MTPTQIERKYKVRARRVMEAIREALQEAEERENQGLLETTEPWSSKDEELRFWMQVGPSEDLIDVTFEFCFSEHWDGEKGGVNFSVNVVHEDGRMIGGLTPYNHTDLVWVKRSDADAVEERFRAMENADPAELVQLIQDWRAKHTKVQGLIR